VTPNDAAKIAAVTLGRSPYESGTARLAAALADSNLTSKTYGTVAVSIKGQHRDLAEFNFGPTAAVTFDEACMNAADFVELYTQKAARKADGGAK
jgi:hypothetical protein